MNDSTPTIRRVLGFPGILLCAVSVVPACGGSTAPDSSPAIQQGCAATCTALDYNLPPDKVLCLDEGYRCGVPSCADGTLIAPSMCTGDGPRCADHAPPVCDPDSDGGS